MPSVYLGGPIAGLTYDEASDWREAATEACAALGYSVYSPMRGKDVLRPQYTHRVFGFNAEVSNGLLGPFARDMHDIRRCDVMIAHIGTSEDVSIGTMIELGAAYALGKFVVVVLPNVRGRPYADTAGRLHPFVAGVATAVVGTIEEAYGVLEALLPAQPAKLEFGGAALSSAREFLTLMGGQDEEDVFVEDED